MPNRFSPAVLEKSSQLRLGSSEWYKLERGPIEAFVKATAGGELEEGVPSLFLLSLLPKLLRDAFEIEGLAEREVVGIDQVRFLLEAKVGSEVRLDAVLLDAAKTKEGHLRCRIGCSIMKREEDEFPAVVTEVVLLAGNA
jgi:hypothetical protein